jgi:hypothetical protein
MNFVPVQIGQAGVVYMLTQLTKMLFLATFFPMPDAEEEEVGCRTFLNRVSILGTNLRIQLSGLAASLVQRCNGTSAGLGSLEVNVICPCKSLIGRLTSVTGTVDFRLGRMAQILC